MGKKKRGHPNVDELLSRPWCYYCERDFEDLKLLISHQKAKHFKCDRCGKRLNTAGGLSVHMNQVHKESLSSVENALPNRQGLDIEIFGMEGVPEDIVAQHNQRIIQNFYTAQAERRAATGNPPPGSQGPAKKIKFETAEELKKRFAEWRTKKATERAAGITGPTPMEGVSPSNNAPPFAPPQAGFPYPPAVPGGPFYSPANQYPTSFPPGAAVPAGGLPTRPPSGATPPTAGLPQRPPYYNGGQASTLDELVSGAARQGDDIDKIIRMAEAGIKPAEENAAPAPAEGAGGKKKKEKSRMVYADTEVSPEEKMALLPKYAFVQS